MNKKLVALAIAGALSAPMMAQAQTANVTLYGSVRGALITTSTSAIGTSPSTRANAVNSISSRLGVRASEGLGGGLTGFAHYEFGINADALGASSAYNGTSAAGGNANFQVREAWVGLSGGFGEVKVGAGLNVYDDVMGMAHNSIVGGFNNINALYFGGINSAATFENYNGCVGTAWDARYGNSIRYASPRLGPVQVKTHAAILNEGGSGKKCSAWDTAIFGGFGPFQAALGYANHNNFAAALSNGARVVDHDAKNVIAMVKGSFGIIDANLGFENAKYSNNHAGGGSAKYRAMVLGVGANFGPTKVGVDYTKRDNGISVGGTSFLPVISSNTAGGGNLATLYVNHNLSKRTIGYFWAGRNSPETGAKQTQLAVALRHNF
jgi:predicted porin